MKTYGVSVNSPYAENVVEKRSSRTTFQFFFLKNRTVSKIITRNTSRAIRAIGNMQSHTHTHIQFECTVITEIVHT
jgi:hypothetical protein